MDINVLNFSTKNTAYKLRLCERIQCVKSCVALRSAMGSGATASAAVRAVALMVASAAATAFLGESLGGGAVGRKDW